MGDVSINIPNDTSKGLSHAIDSKLDTDLGVDVKFTAAQWQSIFDKIKANQAEQNEGQRTFGEKDKDIKKGSQYKVNAGKYNIKESVWNDIVKKAKEAVGIEENDVAIKNKTTGTDNLEGGSPEERNNKIQVKQNNEVQTTKSVEQMVSEEKSQIIIAQDKIQNSEQGQGTENKNNKIEELKTNLERLVDNYSSEPESLQQDLFCKYNTMLEVAKANNRTLSEDEVKTRLNNYAKGWKYHNFEQTSQHGDLFNDGITFNTMDELKAAYQQYGRETAEFYDMDNNGTDYDTENNGADQYEIFFARLKDSYKKKGFTNEQAIARAAEMTNKFKNERLPDENDPLYTSDEMNLFLDCVNEITVKDRNNDGKISASEYAIERLATAQALDNKNSVYHEESYTANLAFRTAGMSETDIIAELGVSEEAAKTIIEDNKKFFGKYNDASELLTGKKAEVEKELGEN